MSEKMTEEALSELFADVLHEWGEWREVMLRHHIAALEAELAEQKALNRRLVDEQCALTVRAEQAERERDEARRIHAANVEAGIELAKEFNRVGGIGYEVDGVFRRARALLSLFLDEKAARERADADNAALTARLRAICDAALETDWMGSNGEREARFSWDEIEFALRDLHVSHPGEGWLKYLLALERVREAVETVRRAIIVVGRTAPIPPDEQAILDACAAADALKGEAKTSPATEAQTEPRHATRENGDCAQWCKACRAEAEARTQPESSTVRDASARCRHGEGTYASEALGEDCENCGEPLCKHFVLVAPAEPSTAEALTPEQVEADVEGALLGYVRCGQRLAKYISLLERRMGAMRRAIDEVAVCSTNIQCSVVRAGMGDPGSTLCPACRARAALTEAPDVFTQEEVREACISNAVDVDAVQAVLEDLAALRKR